MKNMAFVAFVSLLVCSLTAPAAAQERSDQSYRTEMSFGYAFHHDYGENGSGLLWDFGKQIKGHSSLIGEIAMTHFGGFGENYSQVAVGPRFGKVTSPKVRPYAQVLVGLQRSFGVNAFNIQPGAGLNLRMKKRVDTKLQVDFPIVRWKGDTYKQFRFSAGLGLALGK